jgi:Cu+-exporting ATPase
MLSNNIQPNKIIRMEKVNWKVDGMTCTNCALSVSKVLQNQGLQKVSVNAITGDVVFETEEANGTLEKAKKNIEGLGYKVVSEEKDEETATKRKFLGSHLQKFFFCLPFTLILMLGHLGMSAGVHFLHNPWLQFALCLPVYIVGMSFFGNSAIRSLKHVVPNMNVLIALGATAAFIYSIIGTITNDSSKIFYETAASILTIVFFGNWLEDWSIEKTQKTIKELTKQQKVIANMIAYDDAHNENIFPVEHTHLKVGDLILIKTGEQVPIDCKILSGDAEVNEAIISGEGIPVFKTKNDILIGGSVLANGTVKAYVSAVGKDTVMNGIVTMMKNAQGHKAPVQQLADRISGVFVPAVIGIALLTIAVNYFIVDHTFQESLMRSIAVLVIACPCAMGLATPAAIAVGLGRAAKHGILYTDTKSMELFRNIKQMVFDKTGTLTTGKFQVSGFRFLVGSEDEFKKIVYSLEKFSNHPIAKSITAVWKTTDTIKWKKIEELKGVGMKAEDKEGNTYLIGSAKIDETLSDKNHNLFVKKNNQLIGWIDIADEIRPEAKEVIEFCNRKGIKTILLSGDKLEKCKQLAVELNIDEVFAEQSPKQKLDKIDELCKLQPTVMVGDGINDAPALAKATISVSLSMASQLAIQSASVVLMNNGLKKLPMAMMLGKHTYGTVKSNLFWAFLYNIVAIPVAAVGLLTPTAGALIMGLSDVVLAANSLWLSWKKLD